MPAANATNIQLIVGLGNPGPEYARTRHNAGFWFLDSLADNLGVRFREEKKFHGECCRARIEGRDVWLLKPTTFMNASGQAVVALALYYKILPSSILVIHDELDLPIFAYDIPVCVHTKLPWPLLVKLGSEGVLAGVKDSSGDDISFRYLCQENEKAGHPLSLLTGHEIVVDGAYLSGADGSVPGLANVEPEGYVRMWKAAQAGDWATVKAEQEPAAWAPSRPRSGSLASLTPTPCRARSRPSRATTSRPSRRSSWTTVFSRRNP